MVLQQTKERIHNELKTVLENNNNETEIEELWNSIIIIPIIYITQEEV